MSLDMGTGQADPHLYLHPYLQPYLHGLYPPDAPVHSTQEWLTTRKKKHAPTFLPVSVGKFFFSFLSACVHNCNLHVPTCASTPLPAPTCMCLSGHACFLTWAWACPSLPHPCTCVSATPIAMQLTSSCTQRSPQLWVFSDAGAVNSTKGVSGRQQVYSYLSTWLWVAGTGRCVYGYGWAPEPTL